MYFTSLYLIGLMIVLLGPELLVISVVSFLSTRDCRTLLGVLLSYLIVGVLRGFRPREYHFHLIVVPALSGVHLYVTLWKHIPSKLTNSVLMCQPTCVPTYCSQVGQHALILDIYLFDYLFLYLSFSCHLYMGRGVCVAMVSI